MPGLAQARIYRCGNEYTNTVSEAQKGACKLVEGGNVTVFRGSNPRLPAAAPARPVQRPCAGLGGTGGRRVWIRPSRVA